jgi:drug/metabolite transporter (DMT)-like permease
MARFLPYIALVVTMVFWGSAPAFTRLLVTAMPPGDLLVMRFGVVGPLYAGVIFMVTGWRIARGDLVRLIAISLIGMSGFSLAMNFGMVYTPAGIAGLIVATQPLIIIFGTSLVTREKPRGAAIVGSLMAIAGTVVLFWDGLIAPGPGALSPLGVGLMFLSGLFWSYYVIVGKPLIERYGTVQITATTVMISTLPMLSLATSATPHTIATLPAGGWLAFAYLTVCGMIFATLCWNYAVGRLHSSLTAPFLYSIPVIAVVTGHVVLGEAITASMAAGGALIIAGVAWAQFAGRYRRLTARGTARPMRSN